MCVRISAKLRSTSVNKRIFRWRVILQSDNSTAGDEFFIGTGPADTRKLLTQRRKKISAVAARNASGFSRGLHGGDVVSILEKNDRTYRLQSRSVGRAPREMPRAFVKFHIHHIVYGRNIRSAPSPRRLNFQIRNTARLPRPFVQRRKLRQVLKSSKFHNFGKIKEKLK